MFIQGLDSGGGIDGIADGRIFKMIGRAHVTHEQGTEMETDPGG
jgi:hypothetical protein